MLVLVPLARALGTYFAYRRIESLVPPLLLAVAIGIVGLVERLVTAPPRPPGGVRDRGRSCSRSWSLSLGRRDRRVLRHREVELPGAGPHRARHAGGPGRRDRPDREPRPDPRLPRLEGRPPAGHVPPRERRAGTARQHRRVVWLTGASPDQPDMHHPAAERPREDAGHRGRLVRARSRSCPWFVSTVLPDVAGRTSTSRPRSSQVSHTCSHLLDQGSLLPGPGGPRDQ